MQITPINKSNITDEIYQQMIANISIGSWGPGDRIPSENELKNLFNVSRNTIRSVIQRLNVLGILETIRGEGTFIKELGPSIYLNCFIPPILLKQHHFIEIMEFRKGVEVEAAKLVAERASEEDIIKLERILRNSLNKKDNIQEYSQEDINFHVAISKACGNKMFENIMEIVKYILLPKLVTVISHLGNEDSLKYHPLILDAIKSRDMKKAGEYMNEHLDVVITRFKTSNY
ncbi:MAG: FadR/GntR family transcriptional regulator [Clostridia bacterium]